MTLAHIMWGIGGVTVGLLIALFIVEKPYKSNDVEDLLKKKGKS